MAKSTATKTAGTRAGSSAGGPSSDDRPIVAAINACNEAITQKRGDIKILLWGQVGILGVALGLIGLYVYFFHVLPRPQAPTRDTDTSINQKMDDEAESAADESSSNPASDGRTQSDPKKESNDTEDAQGDDTANANEDRGDLSIDAATSSLVNTMILLFAAVYSLMFGVLMHSYRVLQGEIAKLERWRLDLWRVRAVAEESSKSYRDDAVRDALLTGTFVSPPNKSSTVPAVLHGEPRIEMIASALESLSGTCEKALDIARKKWRDRDDDAR